jgi:hypothetical protein
MEEAMDLRESVFWASILATFFTFLAWMSYDDLRCRGGNIERLWNMPKWWCDLANNQTLFLAAVFFLVLVPGVVGLWVLFGRR